MARPTIYTSEMIDKYTRAGYWKPITLSDLWEKNAEDYPDKEAIIDSRVRLTWSQANAWINRLAVGLIELELRKDDVIVNQLFNCVEKALLRVAAQKAGLLHLALLSNLRHSEMEYILKYTEARALVIPWKFRNFDHFQMAQDLKSCLPNLKYILVAGEEVPPEALPLQDFLDHALERKITPHYFDTRKFSSLDVSQILLTTGTTGASKFVESTLCSRIMGNLVGNLKLTSEDTAVASGPATEGPNAVVYYGAPQVAARSVLMEHWSVEEALSLVEREKITILCVVPTMLAQIDTYPHLKSYDLGSVRAIWTSGAPLPNDLALRIEDKLGVPILNAYGSTDFGGITGCNIDDPPEVRLLTAGRPRPGNEIKLLDSSGKEVPWGEIGEIAVRGPFSSSGYYKDPEMTARCWDKDGWYRTGDLGKLDEKGYLTVVGREKEIIIRGGQNIFSGEIEKLLLAHPGVANAAVLGLPHPVMGEIACACIILKPGCSFSFEEMTDFLKSRKIASYKLPERLIIVESFPYFEGLKLDKRTLRGQVIKD